MTQIEAAKEIGVTPRTLRNWARKGKGPAYSKINAKECNYTRRVIDAWKQAASEGISS